MSDKPKKTHSYTGHLRRGVEADTIEGELTDTWGWKIHIRGVRDPAGGYRLTGEVREVPDSLRQPAIDGEG